MSTTRAPKLNPAPDSLFKPTPRLGITSNPSTPFPTKLKPDLQMPSTVMHKPQKSDFVVPPLHRESPNHHPSFSSTFSERNLSSTKKRFANIEVDRVGDHRKEIFGITELSEEQRLDYAVVSARIAEKPPHRSLFDTSPDFKHTPRISIPTDFLAAISFCLWHTPGLSDAISDRNGGEFTRMVAGVCSAKHKEEINAFATQMAGCYECKDSDSVERIVLSMMEKLDKESRRLGGIRELVEIAEAKVYTHKFACNKARVKKTRLGMCLKLENAQANSIETVISQRYAQIYTGKKCTECQIPTGRMHKQWKLTRTGAILVILLTGKEGVEPAGIRSSHTISLMVSPDTTGKLIEVRYSLCSALSYNPSDRSYTSYFTINNKWYLYDTDGIRLTTNLEIASKPCFLLFYSRLSDDSLHPELNSDKLMAMHHPDSFYIPTLCGLIFTQKFISLCLAHKFEKVDSLPGTIADILENTAVKNVSTLIFERVWKKYFLPVSHDISTPGEFLKHFFETITRQDDKRSEQIFDAKFTLTKRCKTCMKSSSTVVREKLIHLPGPTTEVRDYTNITDDFFRDLNFETQLKVKDKNVMRCLTLKQRPINKEARTKLSFCRGGPHKIFVERKKLKETGGLLVFDFYIDNKVICKPQAASLKLEHQLELQQSLPGTSKKYSLKAVIHGSLVYSAYIMIKGVCYMINGDTVKKVEHFPLVMQDIQVVIFEEIGVRNEAQAHSPIFSESTARIGDLFLYLRKRIFRERTIIQIKTHLKLCYLFKVWASGCTPDPPPRSIVPVRGLPNFANNCYLSAVLNCLFFSHDFSSIVKRMSSSCVSELTSALSYFFKHYQSSSADLQGVMRTILKQTGLVRNMPNDSHFFFLTLISKLSDHLPLEIAGKLKSLLDMKIRQSSSTCVNCNPLPTSDHVHSIVLPVLKLESFELEHLLSKYFNSQSDPGSLCRDCRCLLPTPRLLSIGPLLPIFLEYRDTALLATRPVTCPSRIDMNRWVMFSGKYDLFAVVKMRISHLNHVIAAVNTSEQWWCLDDDSAPEKNDSLEEIAGSPYMLFYEKTQVSPKAEVVQMLALNRFSLVPVCLTALFFVQKLHLFLTAQQYQNISGPARSFGEFFLSFQHESLSESLTQQIESVTLYESTPSIALSFIIDQLALEIPNESDIFHRNSEIKKNLTIQFDNASLKCAELHKMVAVMVENSHICRTCFVSNSKSWLDLHRVIRLEVPSRLEETKDAVVFSNSECYFPSISMKYKTYNSAALGEYCAALKNYSLASKRYPETIELMAVDLYTCFRYKYRLFKDKVAQRCKKCQTETAHFSQQFIRFIGSVLIIELIRPDEDSQNSLRKRVIFPYLLDLSEFVDGPTRYELRSFVCQRKCQPGNQGDMQSVSVNVDGNWATFEGERVEATNASTNFYENVTVLVYEQVR